VFLFRAALAGTRCAQLGSYSYSSVPEATVRRYASRFGIPSRQIVQDGLRGRSGKEILLSQAGVLEDDQEDLRELRNSIYRGRGRPETEENELSNLLNHKKQRLFMPVLHRWTPTSRVSCRTSSSVRVPQLAFAPTRATSLGSVTASLGRGFEKACTKSCTTFCHLVSSAVTGWHLPPLSVVASVKSKTPCGARG